MWSSNYGLLIRLFSFMNHLVSVRPYGPKSGENGLKVVHIILHHILMMLQQLPNPLLNGVTIKIRGMNSQRSVTPSSSGKETEEEIVGRGFILPITHRAGTVYRNTPIFKGKIGRKAVMEESPHKATNFLRGPELSRPDATYIHQD